MFEKRVLRRIFGSKRDEVTGNGENYIMRSLMLEGEGRGVHWFLVGKPEGKRPLGRPRRR